MASYPGAVKTFTTKSAGDTIQATHVTDLQDEVTAIEDGLLNGTAPVNSSRITAPAAQITNSTATNQSVTGTSTITELFVTKCPPFARVFASGAQNLPPAAVTALSFDSQRFVSTSAMHSTATNPSRLIAVSSGAYIVSASALIALASTNSTTIAGLIIRLNGSSAIASQFVPGVGVDVRLTVTTPYYFANAGDYVDVCGFQTSGSTASISPQQNQSVEFSLVKVR